MTRFLQDPIARTYDCDIFPHFLNQKEKERKKLMQKNEKRRDNRIQKRRKKGKCGQFAISVLLHALTITLFRQPPLPIHLAPASLSNFSSPSGCEHEEQIWSTPVLFGDVSGKEAKETERREAILRCSPNSWFPFWPCVYFLNVLSYILSWTGVGTKNI